MKQLRYYVGHTDYEFNRERHRERLAKFVSAVAVAERQDSTIAAVKMFIGDDFSGWSGTSASAKPRSGPVWNKKGQTLIG